VSLPVTDGGTDQPEDPPVPSPEEVAAELEEVEALEEAGAVEEARRYPSTIGGAFYLGILVATVTGIGIVWSGNWRLGVRWMAGALLVAAVLRLLLPAKDAGMLAVRHRAVDCVLLAGLGGALVFLAQTIPNQPGF
jgi:hypothetical protein